MTTTLTDNDDPVFEEPMDSVARDSGTLLEQLRAKREGIRRERRIILDIPGYGGTIAARYRPLSWEVLKDIGQKAEKSKHPKKELVAHADTIARACEELYARRPEDPRRTLIPLSEVLGTDGPVTFASAELPGAFGFSSTSTRQAVFGLINDELAITAHHNELAEWMQDADSEDDEVFVGESGGTV